MLWCLRVCRTVLKILYTLNFSHVAQAFYIEDNNLLAVADIGAGGGVCGGRSDADIEMASGYDSGWIYTQQG